MSSARQLLHLYLSQQAARGVTHVSLSDTALTALRSGGNAPVKVQEQPARSSQPMAPAPTHSIATSRPSVPAATPAPVENQPTQRPLSKREELEKVYLQAETSQEARNIGSLLETMVFATGNADADIMFIGEAPGSEEEKLREPFVGPAGQLLTRIIQAMGIGRGDVYISNICKYRPRINDGRPQGNRNRQPTPGEMHTCLPFVTAEIAIVQPKVIVALGATAATGLGIEGSVGKLRGRFSVYREVPVMVTYHPSFLLRREAEDGGGIAEKRLVWEDMMMVMEHVGLPISAKQRGYFTKVRS